MTLRLNFLLLGLLFWSMPGAAHESRPAYLQVDETQLGQYDVLWKRPALGDRALGLTPIWPEECRDKASGTAQAAPGAVTERRLIDCGEAGLVGRRIAIAGLSTTLTDVLVRIQFLDGRVQTNLVKPAAPSLLVEGRRSTVGIAAEYLRMGIEHILFGVDHLLFVFGLIVIVRAPGALIKTITAFTLAHSVTLALATLGFVHVPQAPVEAVIALSILFLAIEMVRQHRGQDGLTARMPWLVAFGFGLLHGFGFAGALAEVGLPVADIPLALVMFNVGVEIGQALFIAAVLALLWIGRRAVGSPSRWVRDTPAYLVGSLAAFWLLERLASFV